MKQSTTRKEPSTATALSACTSLAVDLAKQVFQIAAEDAFGQVLHEQHGRLE